MNGQRGTAWRQPQDPVALIIARRRAAEFVRLPQPEQREAIVAGLLECVEGARRHTTKWKNSSGEHTSPTPQWHVMRAVWMDIAKLGGLLLPELHLHMNGPEQRAELATLARRTVEVLETREAIYAALVASGFAAEAVEELSAHLPARALPAHVDAAGESVSDSHA